MLNATKISIHVRNLCRIHTRIEKILACIDCEHDSINQLQNKVSEVHEQLKNIATPIVSEYIIVMRALESWTGADGQALKSYLGVPARIQGIKEDNPRPKETLIRLFWKHRKRDFVETRDNPELAKIVSLNVLRTRNKSFALFQEKVIDP